MIEVGVRMLLWEENRKWRTSQNFTYWYFIKGIFSFNKYWLIVFWLFSMLGEYKDKSGMNRFLSTSICLRNKVINVLTGTEFLTDTVVASLSFLHVKCFCCTCDSLPFWIWHRLHLETGQLINYRWELVDKDPACPLRLSPPEVLSGIAP